VYEDSTTETHPRMLMVNALLWLGKITIGIHTTVATDEQINISCLQRILGMLHKHCTTVSCTLSSSVHIWSSRALNFSVCKS